MMGQAMLDGKEPLPEYHSGEATWHGPKWQGEAQRIMHHSCELQSSDNTVSRLNADSVLTGDCDIMWDPLPLSAPEAGM